MDLSSALDLKRELMDVHFNSTGLSILEARGERRNVPILGEDIAIGIGRSPKGFGNQRFGIGVVVPNRLALDSHAVEVIRERSREECDIVVSGPVRPRTAWHLAACTPLRIGASVGHPQVTAGTLGCFVRSRGSGKLGILSNNHVLASSNRARLGDPILQPAKLDGASPNDIVGTLAGVQPIRWNGNENLMDAAWAQFLTRKPDLEGRHLTDSGGASVGRVSQTGAVEALPGDYVIKVGRSTGCTYGRVRQIMVDAVKVPYGRNLATFSGQILVESRSLAPFSLGGDSGSVVWSEGLEPVGLLFAGSNDGGTHNSGLTYVSPIAAVLDALDLDIVME